jgi:hypothetical protein
MSEAPRRARNCAPAGERPVSVRNPRSSGVYPPIDPACTARASQCQALHGTCRAPVGPPNTLFGGQADAGGDFILRGVAQFASGASQTGGSFYWRVNARVDNGTNNLTGINFLVAPTGGGSGASIMLSDIQFNGGNGFVNVAGVNGTYIAPNSNNFYNLTVVPAPGALALLGAAGLVSGRRRRA